MGILGNTNVELMILPVFNNVEDTVLYTDVCEAIKYAKKMGANICNISSCCSDGEKELENVIQESNMYVIAAAGNFQNQFFQDWI